MRATRILLHTALWICITFSASAQSASRGPMSTSTIGHMAVTLLSPAALTSSKNLQFNDITLSTPVTSLMTGQTSSAAVNYEMSMASVKISGAHSTYSVTVSNKKMGLSQNGKALSVSNFSSISTIEDTGVSNIYIGATMKISEKETAEASEVGFPLAVTINYN